MNINSDAGHDIMMRHGFLSQVLAVLAIARKSVRIMAQMIVKLVCQSA